MQGQLNQKSKVREWRHMLLFFTSGLLLFETITGLSIYLLPFSIPNQVMVLLHTGIGLIFLIPFGWYQIRHWHIYRTLSMTHIKLTGYFSLAATLVAIVSGLVLTYQAVWGTRISDGWDLAHIIATFTLVAAVMPHIGVLLYRDFKARHQGARQPILRAQKEYGLRTVVLLGVLFAVVALLAFAYEPVKYVNELPDDYSYVYGPDRPFAPSLATTKTGGAYDARSLGNSEGCGTAQCHEQIFKEWSVSAHNYAAKDPAFRAVQSLMAEQNGPESTRYCGGCHDPISLFSGTKNIFTEELTNLIGYQEGVSCIVCHAIKETDIKGNASYVITQPRRYMFELSEGDRVRFFRDFLIRAYPRYHVESLQRRLFKSSEFCSACHKQFIDEEINNVGWVQLQNQYDNWRKSRWNQPGDPTATIECRECHMPLVDSNDPGSGDVEDYNRTSDDRKHRSHRFLGANQFIPVLLNSPGGAEHVALTEQWLRGEIEIPEIADKWTTGPAVPLELSVPDQVNPGEQVTIQTTMLNNKVGHDFPTGPLDIIQAWVELTVTDQNGNEIFVSGHVDEGHFIQPGSFIFKVEAVDQYGNLIDRHNLWEMVGVRYRRTLYPGASDRAEFAFSCPSTWPTGDGELSTEEEFTIKVPDSEVTELHVTARLLYRKVDQYFLNFVLGEDSGITAPVTAISEDRKTIKVNRL